MTPTSQRISDVLKMDEGEERFRQAADVPGVRSIFAPFYDDTTRSVYDVAVDAQDDRMVAMYRSPFTAWMSTPPGLDIAEFAMPTTERDRAECNGPTARYRVL